MRRPCAVSGKILEGKLPSSEEKSHIIPLDGGSAAKIFPELAQVRLLGGYMYVIITDSFQLEQNIGTREDPVDELEVAKATRQQKNSSFKF